MSEPETAAQPPAPPDSASTGAHAPAESAAALARILDEYLADLQAGRTPDRARLLATHPDLASQLEQCLAGIEFIHRAAHPNAEAPACLGDFRLVCEIGRGGMGVVYEAEQLSLKRTVALKVLRFGAAPDAEALQRFRREAETLAGLHHTNIVPIHAVGCDNGVHYYAMQFIQGQSLAATLDESRQRGASLDPKEAARWCLQVAEALAYAHQRGVVHRDVKPSNLLLDPQGIVWLTDFGLARRADEVTLTVAGALLGTPRYMSPEQAAALQPSLDHRTDIYSLGASLYELTTGRPVFDADTPHAVITQILNTEPVPPRQVRRSLPRDLETIILKCLAKEPAQRYDTAQALADDLRAFLEGRPLEARRPSLAERSIRWARRQRRSAVVAMSGAAGAILLVAVGVWGWQTYRDAQRGYLTLMTDGPPLIAELLDEADEPVVPEFTVPTRQAIAVPAGSYRLRLSRPGLPSETAELFLGRGDSFTWTVALGDRLLWEPVAVPAAARSLRLPLPEDFAVVNLSGRLDVVLVTDRGLRRLDGATGKEVWHRSLDRSDQPAAAQVPEYEWKTLLRATVWKEQIEPDQPRPIQPAPDLDGDGIGDLVYPSRNLAALLAVSGKTGDVLWAFYAPPFLPGADGRGEPARSAFPPAPQATVVGLPALADIDGDGVPDLIATFVAGPQTLVLPAEPKGRLRHEQIATQRWIEAVSGRTGQSLWRYRLPDAWFAHDHDPPAAAQVVMDRGERTVVCLAGSGLVVLGMDGNPVRVQDTGLRAARPPQLIDLDGDGRPEFLFLTSHTPDTQALVALSLDGRLLWRRPVALPPRATLYDEVPAQEPIVADLDGDGNPEVIVPYLEPQSQSRLPTCGIEVLSGKSGELRWRRVLGLASWAWSRGPRVLIGPDLDGDRCRELFVAAPIRLEAAGPGSADLVRVEALSGSDGHTLWWKMPTKWYATVGPLAWGPPGPDGWPQLLVPAKVAGSSPATGIFAAGNGQLQEVIPGVSQVQAADFNGDGIPDLYYKAEHREKRSLTVIRGTSPEAWQRLGSWRPAADFDGDGIPDLLNSPGTLRHNTVAVSGRDGTVLWQATAPTAQTGSGWTPLGQTLATADLDGDGYPDAVVVPVLTTPEERPYLEALSGKHGHRLWRASELAPGGARLGIVHSLVCRDLDGEGVPEVVVAYSYSEEAAATPPRTFGRLAVLSGRDGRVRWLQALDAAADVNHPTFQPALADLNGDGVLDLLVLVLAPAERPEETSEGRRFEVQALDGRDGRLLWRHSLAATTSARLHALRPRLTVGHLDGSGRPAVIVADYRENQMLALALDGRNGQLLWTWKDGIVPDQELSGLQTSPPLLLDQDDGSHCVCVNGQRESNPGQVPREIVPQLVFLDAQGNVLRRRDVWNPQPGLEPVPVYCLDLDGSGRGALVVASDQKLWATRGSGPVLWEWPLPNGLGPILDTLPARASYPATVAVAAGETVFGIDGATGRPRWRCDGPGRPFALLAPALATDLPRVLYQVSGRNTHLCRLAQPTDESGTYVFRGGVPRAYDTPVPDPRRLRPLPWERWPSVLPVVLVRKGPALLLLGLLGYWAWHRQRRRAGGLFVFSVALALLIGAVWLWYDAGRLLPDQQYSLAGCYSLWFDVLGALGGFLLLRAVLRLGRMVLRRSWTAHGA